MFHSPLLHKCKIKFKCDICDQIKLYFFVLTWQSVWCSTLAASWFFALLFILRLFFSPAEMPFWHCCTLADNFCSWFDLSEPCRPARFSYGCKINVMLVCFNCSKTHHLQKSFHTTRHPWPQKPSLAPALCFKISRTLWSSSASLCSTPPSHLSELSAALPLWLWTFQTGSPHAVSYIPPLLCGRFHFCHVLPLFWYVYLADWILFTKLWNFNNGNCIWSWLLAQSVDIGNINAQLLLTVLFCYWVTKV